MLRRSGFDRIEVLHEWSSPDRIGPDMRRLRLLAQESANEVVLTIGARQNVRA